MNRSSQLRFAVASIFKNEAPYILEWIGFHRAIGVDHFFIADNNSSDDTTEILSALAKVGVVTHIPFPTAPVPERPPQVLAYEKILQHHASGADWIAFLDADEFLVPVSPDRSSLASIISDLDPGPNVGAIAVNWALYGSSGHKKSSPIPVIERFTKRAKRDDRRHYFYKSIIRPAHYGGGELESSHYFPLKNGSASIHVDGSPLLQAPGRAKCFSAQVVWSPLRINHYVVKSWEEFYHRKRARGRGMRVNEFRDEAFFRHHDRNEVEDPVPSWLVAVAETERRRLASLISSECLRVQVHEASSASRWKAPVTNLLRKLREAPHGDIDTVEADEHAPRPIADPSGKLRTPGPKGARNRPVRVPDRPGMPAEAVDVLAEAIRQANCYLEYGSGGSTVLAVDIGVATIVSVESDRDWLRIVRNKLAARADLDRHSLLHADIGPTKAFGYPISDARWRDFRAYPLGPWDLCRSRGLIPDVVLVDGRFRVACFLASLLFGRPGCRILFDDYVNRPHYHMAGSFTEPRRLIERVAEFAVPEAVDRDRAWQALLQAVTDPR